MQNGTSFLRLNCKQLLIFIFWGVAKPSNGIKQKTFSIEYNIQKYLEWDLICLRKTIQEKDPELLDYTSYIKNKI